MSPIRELRELRLEPEIARPSARVRVSASVRAEPPLPTSVIARLYDWSGKVASEVDLRVVGEAVEGVLIVPEGAGEGVYEVVLSVPELGQTLAPLLVLSEETELSVTETSKADETRSEAYRLVAEQRTEEALQLLEEAEKIYRDAGWEHFEVDAMLERVHLLQARRPDEAHRVSVLALGKLNRLGLESWSRTSWGRAGVYFRRAKALARDLNEPREGAVNASNLGEVLVYMRFVDDAFVEEARENFAAALSYATAAGDQLVEATARENLAATYWLRHEFTAALTELTRALELFQQLRANDAVERISEKAERLGAIRASGRMDRVRTDPQLPTLGDILHDVVGRLRVSAEERRINVGVQVPPGLPVPGVDPWRLDRFLELFLKNMLAFTPAGSVLILSARLAPEHGRVGVRIEISGIEGTLPPEALERLFEPLVTPERIEGGATLSFWMPVAGS